MEDDTLCLGAGRDPEGDSVTISAKNKPSHGELFFDHQNMEMSYIPDQYWSGTDSFYYLLTDTTGAADSQQVAVTVVPVHDDAPVSLIGYDLPGRALTGLTSEASVTNFSGLNEATSLTIEYWFNGFTLDGVVVLDSNINSTAGGMHEIAGATVPVVDSGNRLSSGSGFLRK